MKIILQPNPPTAIASTSLSGGSSPTKAVKVLYKSFDFTSKM
jgi:hypothetical protein